MGVGFPAHILLQEFGSRVCDAFDEIPYHVGSSLTEKAGWRDVDVRLMLDAERYAALGLGDPLYPHHNAKWVALCLAFTELGKAMTGLPIDFQIQQTEKANNDFPGQRRSSLGIVPWRIKE
jgi:hypothetical protein